MWSALLGVVGCAPGVHLVGFKLGIACQESREDCHGIKVRFFIVTVAIGGHSGVFITI